MVEMPVSLGQRLAATARAADRALDDMLGRAGGNRSMWRVLTYLSRRPAATQAELARAMGLTAQTLSHHLSKLEFDELILRERDAIDRRSYMVTITDAGRERRVRLLRAFRRHDEELRSRLTFDDEDELLRLLDRVDRVFGVGGPAGLERRRLADARRRIGLGAPRDEWAEWWGSDADGPESGSEEDGQEDGLDEHSPDEDGLDEHSPDEDGLGEHSPDEDGLGEHSPDENGLGVGWSDEGGLGLGGPDVGGVAEVGPDGGWGTSRRVDGG